MPGYEISATGWPHLLRALDDEYERARLGPAARWSFGALEAVGYALPLVLGFALLGSSLAKAVEKGRLSLPRGLQDLCYDVTALLGGLLWLLSVALVALLIANLPLLANAYRQWRLSGKLDTLKLLDRLLSEPPRWSRLWQLKLLALVPPAVLASIPLTSLFAGSAVTAPVLWRSAPALLLTIVLPAVLHLADRLFRKLESRLEYLDEVLALQKELETFEGQTSLPAELAARVAEVERSHVLSERAEALRRRPKAASRTFAVSKSDAVMARLDRLEAGRRVAVEEALADLARRLPASSGELERDVPKTLEAAGEVWRLEVETDFATRTLVVTSLRADGEPAP